MIPNILDAGVLGQVVMVPLMSIVAIIKPIKPTLRLSIENEKRKGESLSLKLIARNDGNVPMYINQHKVAVGGNFVHLNDVKSKTNGNIKLYPNEEFIATINKFALEVIAHQYGFTECTTCSFTVDATFKSLNGQESVSFCKECAIRPRILKNVNSPVNKT